MRVVGSPRKNPDILFHTASESLVSNCLPLLTSASRAWSAGLAGDASSSSSIQKAAWSGCPSDNCSSHISSHCE